MTIWIDPAFCMRCPYCLGDIDTQHPSGQKIPKCSFDTKIIHLRLGPFTGKVQCPKRDLLSRAGSSEVTE